VALADRGARLVLAALVGALGIATLALDLPRASDREFWGDGATYYAMAWSLARDLDLRYEAADLRRVELEYPGGPQGLFLKRAHGGLTIDRAHGFPWVRPVPAAEGRLYYAKAFAYPAVAAPLVALLGTRGLAFGNALLLGLALFLGYHALRRLERSPLQATLLVVSFFGLSVAPLYVVWPTPEILGLAVVTAGLWAWASGRPLLAAVLFGVAVYAKPPNVLMAAPLGLAPLLPGPGEGLDARRAWRGLVEALRRGAVLALAAGSLYGLNAAFTGELNYQGGERKTFYGRFPEDAAGTTFDSAGQWMSTEHLGPLVQGSDEHSVTARTGPARDPAEVRESFVWNLGYFWTGRFGGVLAYYFPALLAALLFLIRGPRSREAGLALGAVVLSWIAYIWIIPDNWYGGGGTVGNRYFLNLLPAFLLIVPRGREGRIALGAVVGALAFLAPVLVSPVYHSRHPGEHATRGVYRILPAELTMLNDLSVFTEPWRKKRPFGFVGNAARHADPDAFFLYFLDDGTFGKEEWAGRTGFWLKAGGRAEVVVRAFDLAPVERIVVRLTGGPLGDAVTVAGGGRRTRVAVGPGQVHEVGLRPGPGLRYYDTYLHVLRLGSQRGAALADGREVSAFVELELEMRPPFPRSGP
jgi:hypothetical protein